MSTVFDFHTQFFTFAKEANYSFYCDVEEKLSPKFEHFEFDVYNPELIEDKMSLLTISSTQDTNSGSG